MLLLKLYFNFFKIGLFGFGGGYAMVSLIQKVMAANQWLSAREFIDLIAIAEMTPGPIAINSGTMVGYNVGGFLGSFLATLGVISPSFILILLLAYYFNRLKDSTYILAILKYLRPVVVSLILGAGITLTKESIIDIKGVVIALVVIGLKYKTSLHPIFLIIMAGLAGLILYA